MTRPQLLRGVFLIGVPLLLIVIELFGLDCVEYARMIANRNAATPDLIDEAFNNGEITDGQRILYYAYSTYEPSSLPLQFKGHGLWCGTSTVGKVDETIHSVDKLCKFNPAIQAELRRLFSERVVKCSN